jgi:hypothetical protein
MVSDPNDLNFDKKRIHPLYSKHSSPKQIAGEGLEKGFLTGTGVISADYIIESGGQTYDDTTIDLKNPDTKERLAKAQAFLASKDTKGLFDTANEYDAERKKKVEEERAKFFNNFAAEMQKPEIVGPYFQKVTELEAREAEILSKGYARILSPAESTQIAGIEKTQSETRSATFTSLNTSSDIKAQLKPLEDNSLKTDNAVLDIRKKASERVLGSAAEKVSAKAKQEVSLATDYLSSTEIKAREVTRLESAAAEASLTTEEKTELAEVRTKKDEAWKDKHKSEKDFSDAIKNNSQDCSEFSSFSAVALKKKGFDVKKVCGHVYEDGDDMVGSHAYNVVLEKRNGVSYVAGVFDATAPDASFRKVTNDVTLADFEKKHTTLVTFNEKSGWTTYGTGKYEGGRASKQDMQYEYVIDAEDKIVRTDTKLIAKEKIEYTRNLDPKMLTDKLHNMMEQYNISHDNFDGRVLLDLAKEHKNPRMAAAMELLVGLPDRDKATAEQLAVYAKADDLLSNKDIADKDLSRVAVTEHTIAEYESSWPALKVARDLHTLVNSKDITPEMKQQNPWLGEVEKLLKGKADYTDSLLARSYKNYERVETLVMDNNISFKQVEALSAEAEKAKMASTKLELQEPGKALASNAPATQNAGIAAAR